MQKQFEDIGHTVEHIVLRGRAVLTDEPENIKALLASQV
jgi:hypothetical protein